MALLFDLNIIVGGGEDKDFFIQKSNLNTLKQNVTTVILVIAKLVNTVI